MEELKKAVLYMRYSSSNQSEQSIEGQRRVCSEFAERNGYKIINEYVDRATTGTNAHRPAFLEMVDRAKNGAFNYVIVYKLDRFSRNKYDSVVYKHKLKGYNVKVISATEAISDTIEGKIMETLIEAMAEMYSDELSQKVKRGMKESIIKGQYIGGVVPMGYKIENKRFIIDQERAELVKFIFEEYKNGQSQKQIIDKLNNLGHLTQQGGIFNPSSLARVLSNRRYLGEFVYGGEIIKNYCPAIIDKETFDKAQEKLIYNRHNGGAFTAKVNYLLSGKLFCGLCGSSMPGVSGVSARATSENKIYYYYACGKRWKSKQCNKANERKEDLEQFIIEATLKHVLNKRIIKAIAENLEEAQEEETTESKIKSCKLKISFAEKQINKKYQLFCETENKTIRNKLEEDIKKFSEQQEQERDKITALQLEASKPENKKEILQRFYDFIENRGISGEYGKKIINEFVDRIFVFEDKIIIYYNIFNKSGVTYERALLDERNSKELDNSNIDNKPSPIIFN